MTDDRSGGLLAWQWSKYSDGHRSRPNLAVHIVTVPLFLLGTITFVAAPFAHLWWAAVGLGAMALAMAAQGRTHRLEAVPPLPFRGPTDVLARIFVEQWWTFPRFVWSGAFARAWRASA